MRKSTSEWWLGRLMGHLLHSMSSLVCNSCFHQTSLLTLPQLYQLAFCVCSLADSLHLFYTIYTYLPHLLQGYDNVPVECRMCIRVADLYRRGGTASPAANHPEASTRSITVQVRSRGFYQFMDLTLNYPRDAVTIREAIEHLYSTMAWGKV